MTFQIFRFLLYFSCLIKFFPVLTIHFANSGPKWALRPAKWTPSRATASPSSRLSPLQTWKTHAHNDTNSFRFPRGTKFSIRALK